MEMRQRMKRIVLPSRPKCGRLFPAEKAAERGNRRLTFHRRIRAPANHMSASHPPCRLPPPRVGESGLSGNHEATTGEPLLACLLPLRLAPHVICPTPTTTRQPSRDWTLHSNGSTDSEPTTFIRRVPTHCRRKHARLAVMALCLLQACLSGYHAGRLGLADLKAPHLSPP